MSDENYLDDIFSKKSERKNILDSIKSFEDDDVMLSSNTSSKSYLPSDMFNEVETRKEEKKKNKKKNKGDDNWLDDIMKYSDVKINKHAGIDPFGDFEDYDNEKKKKKKKDKKKDKQIDYSKEFEPELALYRNLLINQSNFTDSLQREYNDIKSIKASSRGVNKSMSDLIENITQARSLQMQLVEKQVSAKKLIAELKLKQQKESADADMGDAGLLGASALKSILDNRNLFSSDPSTGVTITDVDDDSFVDVMDGITFDDDRSEDSEKYLKYEKAGVVVRVAIANDDIENYWFEAMDSEYNIIDDYPLPPKTSISVNRSTNIATDAYGQKYEITWK